MVYCNYWKVELLRYCNGHFNRYFPQTLFFLKCSFNKLTNKISIFLSRSSVIEVCRVFPDLGYLAVTQFGRSIRFEVRLRGSPVYFTEQSTSSSSFFESYHVWVVILACFRWCGVGLRSRAPSTTDYLVFSIRICIFIFIWNERRALPRPRLSSVDRRRSCIR